MRKRYQKNKVSVLKRCAEYRKRNAKKIKRYLANWYLQNKDHVLKRCAEYRQRDGMIERESARQKSRYEKKKKQIQATRKKRLNQNPDVKAKYLAYQREHYLLNKPSYIEKSARKRARKMAATPSWANIAVIRQFYQLAAKLTKETGIRYAVDHVVPLQGRNVCGLHVENNLQVIPHKANLQKHNKFG
jgi:tRNA U54 and U55 pseudouridine synthase Pus10